MPRARELNAESLFLTPEQVARIMGVSSRQVRKMCTNGKLPAMKFGSQWRINKEQFSRKVDLMA